MQNFSGFGFESDTGQITIIMDMSLEGARKLCTILNLAGVECAYSEHAGFAAGVPAKARFRFFPPKPISEADTVAIIALLDQPPELIFESTSRVAGEPDSPDRNHVAQ